MAVVPPLLMLMSGCVGLAEDTSPKVRFVERPPAQVLLRTGYDSQGAASDNAVALPSGTPAKWVVFDVVLTPVPGLSYPHWDGDLPCEAGYVNEEAGYHRPSHCPSEDQAAIVVPPPNGTTTFSYRLDTNGSRMLFFPQPVRVMFRLSALYSEPLLDARQDPEGCDALHSYAVGSHAAIRGAIQSDGDWLLPLGGNATVSLPYHGICTA